MEQEVFFSGYCRILDDSRMVCVIKEDGTLTEVDCCYLSCPHTAECTVAASIRDFIGS
ncbi:MAG: hypothetical protein IJO28_06320 [Oscillospiraceae bacterium]|nr:hypothetical protein [Oscillospiraceae bacterium]